MIKIQHLVLIQLTVRYIPQLLLSISFGVVWCESLCFSEGHLQTFVDIKLLSH